MSRPNVIVFLTDQQRHDSCGLHGNPLELTLNFDRLARRGTHLEHCLTPQPVCGPARACLQTGLYPTTTGVHRNGLPLPPQFPTMANHFNDAGYQTAYIGKWHLGDPKKTGAVAAAQRGGYSYWRGAGALEMVSEPYRCVLFDEEDREIVRPGYRADALTDAAIEFLDRKHEKPFFLFVSYLEPHQSNRLDAFVAPDGYAERYRGRWTPPDLAALRGQDESGLVGGDAQRQLGGYWGMCKRLDENLGRLQDALKSLDLAGETTVLFTSDHGCQFGTRRKKQDKCSPHEASVRVPGALWGGPFEGGGQVVPQISLLDIAPTLLESCEIPVPAAMQGRSLMPLLRDRRTPWKDEVLIQVSQTNLERALRTPKWKYVVAAPAADAWKDASSDHYVETELYDLEHDPYELSNLVGRASHGATSEILRAKLGEKMREAGETVPQIEAATSRPSKQLSVTDEEAHR